jgi:FkbM family methyltransferase
MDDFFDKVLHYYGRKGVKLFMINIGAMDGVLFDAMSGYVDIYNSDVLYVEPMKPHFERLIQHKGHHSGNIFENSAISDYNGTVTMKTIPIEVVDEGLVHPAFYGMSVIDPSKNGMGSEYDKEVVEKYAVDVEVNCITWDTLLYKHNIQHFDVLSVDTEGHDFTIFKQIDLQKYRPRLIRLEWCNLTQEEKDEVKRRFDEAGYVYEILDNMDIDAIRQDVYDEISTSLLPEEINSEEKMSSVTIVTGLWNIKREELSEGWSRSFQHYLDKFSQLLDIPNNMIIFGDAELEEFVFKKRTQENTQFIVRDQSWFKGEFYEPIQQIRTNPDWYNQVGWLSESTQARLDMYNPLVMSKPYLMHDAKILDKFGSTHLYWLDAGITNTVHHGYFTHDRVLDKLNKIDKITFIAFPYETTTEIHGFNYKKLNELAGDKVNKVCRGGFFGGPVEEMSNFNNQYYNLMRSTLYEKYMGTEESLFSILLYRYPEMYQYFPIEGNGLISKFFEDVKNDQHKPLDEFKYEVVKNDLDITNTALYVITFNSPNQIKTLIKSMMEYDSDFVTKPQWVVLDNSTDLSTSPEYEVLAKEHNMIYVKKDNLGICGGRQWVAEHAEENGYDYYFFFEDDMFFYPKPGEVCKNGFNRYVKGLYRKSLQIAKKNNFDFLKLSFTEFYGDNRTQWAWYNVPQTFREQHWPEKPILPVQGLDPNAPKTKITKVDSFEGIPFAHGEIYYCNWPQVVSKYGNKKMFLTEKWARPFEQTWMSYMFQETIKGNLHPGILLLSPTEHDRFDHYDGNLRKES